MPIDRFQLQHLAVPAVLLLIAFLAYGSQVFLLPWLEPGDLTKDQKWKFNVLLAGIWVSYWRAVTVDPGHVPPDWGRDQPKDQTDGEVTTRSYEIPEPAGQRSRPRPRWCRKCERAKPPRAHHCKVCKRCIPRMDHHCPWTANCVSHFTLPHFMRFLTYATMSMIYLEYFLMTRVLVLWENRAMPSYLGPSTKGLIMLFVYIVVNSLTLFAVGIIFVRTLYDMACNTTTIEGWEISRHEQLLRRARALGGFLYGPDGQRIIVKRQEFPYDIGIWTNICQGMGTRNPVLWLWVFSGTRSRAGGSGLTWETNGFEDESVGWPPIDPDRIPRTIPWGQPGNAFTHDSGYGEASPQEQLDAFRQRQADDLKRRELTVDGGMTRVVRRKRFHTRFDPTTHEHLDGGDRVEEQTGSEYESGEEGWRDHGGSRLDDYGVDEEVEFYDERDEDEDEDDDDVPLGQLLRQRRAYQEHQ